MSGNFTEEEKRHLMQRVDSIHETVHGAGESPGIKGRLDRLEQAHATRSKLTWIALGTAIPAFIGLLGAAIKALFSNPTPPAH